MAQNFTDSPSNGATQTFNGVIYTYNSTKNIWSAKTAGGIALTDLSVGSEPTASGNGDVSYNNTTGVITYTPPVIGSGGTTTVYNTASLLPLSGNSEGDMAFAKDNNRFYVWNGAGWYSVALVNASPTISSGVASNVSLATDGTATVVTITASDPEGTSLNYAYSVTSGSLTNGGGTTATVVQGTGASTNVFTVTPTTTEAYAGNFSLTFTASDGVSTAVSAGAFTLVFSAPQHSSTTLKVKTSGNNGRNNAVFNDSSSSNLTITPNGTVFQSSFTPFSDNWSNYFDGTGDYLTSATSSDYTLGSSDDWTVELWFYATAHTSGLYHSHTSSLPSSSQGHGLGISNASKLLLYQNGSNQTVDSPVVSLYEWHHVAISRASGTKRVFLDGLLVKEISETEAYTGTYMTVGGYYSTGYLMNGYISDFHYIKGTAKYTASFTPSLEKVTAHSNTKLLTCRSNRFIDESASPHAITMNGNAIISTLSPLTIPDEWNSGDDGSVWFEGGQTNFLSLPAIAVGTNTYEVSGWFWDETASGWGTILTLGAISASSPYAGIRMDASRGEGVRPPAFFNDSGGGGAWECEIADTVTSTKNAWTHFVFSRNASNECKMFLNGVQKGSTITNTASIPNTATNYIGKGGSANQSFYGYLADFRIQVGGTPITANFTPPTSASTVDSNTKLKLKFEQAGVFDSVSKNDLKLHGDAQESTAQTKYATTSIKFDGTGDYLTIEDYSNYNFASPWNFEAWIYPTNLGSGFNSFYQIGVDSSNGFVIDMSNGGSTPRFLYHVGSWSTLSSSATISNNAWSHISVIWSGSAYKIFVNGVETASATSSTAITNPTARVQIGRATIASGAHRYYTGYIEDARFLSGHTIYPNERPQAALTAVSGTTVQFANASTVPSTINGQTVSITEAAGGVNPTVSTVSPPYSDIGYSIEYSGGQMHYIAYSSNTHLATNDFTIEFHAYIKEWNTTYMGFLNQRHPSDASGNSGSGNDWAITYTSARMDFFSGGYLITMPAPELKKWKHYVVQRKTISGTKTFQIFINGVLVNQLVDPGKNFYNVGLSIGGAYTDVAENGSFYMSDFRLNNGNAIYDTSFTPPSSAL